MQRIEHYTTYFTHSEQASMDEVISQHALTEKQIEKVQGYLLADAKQGGRFRPYDAAHRICAMVARGEEPEPEQPARRGGPRP